MSSYCNCGLPCFFLWWDATQVQFPSNVANTPSVGTSTGVMLLHCLLRRSICIEITVSAPAATPTIARSQIPSFSYCGRLQIDLRVQVGKYIKKLGQYIRAGLRPHPEGPEVSVLGRYLGRNLHHGWVYLDLCYSVGWNRVPIC